MKPENLSDYNFRQALKSLVRRDWVMDQENFPTADDVLRALSQSGCLALPGGGSVFALLQRFPVYADIQRPRSSILAQVLRDRGDETVLVVDSRLSGKDALLACRMCGSLGELSNWVACLQWPRAAVHCQPYNHEEVIVVSPLASFVVES